MFTINVININGGVGKTHTADNLAVGFAAKGKKVLIIDADPQATTTDTIYQIGNEFGDDEIRLFEEKVSSDMENWEALAYVTEKDSPTYDLSDVLEEPKLINRAIYPTRIENIDIIPSSTDLDESEQRILEDKTRSNVERLKQAFRYIEKEYDFVIIDEAPSVDLIITNSLFVTDLVIIPMKTDRKSRKGAIRTLRTLSTISGKNDLDFDFKIVLQMVTHNSNDKKIISFYRKYFSEDLFQQTVRFQAKPISDADAKNDFVINDRRANVAKDYQALVDEIFEYIENRKKG